MKRFGLLVLLLCLGGCADSQTQPEQEVRAAEAAQTKAFVANDYAALEKLWSPQLVVNSPANRVLHKAAVLGFMHAGGFKYTSYEQTVESVAVFGDTAVSMGHEWMTESIGPAAGKPYQLRYMDVWQRAKDGWVMIARQGAAIAAK